MGFCAAALAFGRVRSVLASLDTLLSVMGSAPAAFVRRFEPERDGVTLQPFVHRWTRGVDLIALLWILRRMLELTGSIEAFFLHGYRSDAEGHRRRFGLILWASARVRSRARVQL